MELYDAINARRTVRDFAAEAMDPAALRRILDAAMKAPTNDHMRDWHFVVIDDPAVVRRLIAEIPQNRPAEQVDAILRDWHMSDPSQRRMYQDAIPKQYRMLSEAACVVLPLFRQKTELLKPQNLSALNAFASIWCCIENLLLAATAEGYGCALRIPMGDEQAHARDVLGYPEDYCMPCYLALGTPAPDAVCAAQKPYELEERIHRNQW